MKRALFLTAVVTTGLCWAQTAPRATLMPGLGNTHHQVTTKSPQAQKFFDQGLSLIYAFNHEEAVRSFARAAELDPGCAMAYWGIALAVGPNYNDPGDPERLARAVGAVNRARAAEHSVSAPERAYIDALAKRYSPDPKTDPHKMAIDYRNAMRDLVRRYPNDLDAATLFAESAMDLRPWQLWTPEGKAAEGTEEILRTLESVLKRSPNHLGANHYYIHATEASGHPEKALASAERVRTLAPAAGHLVHMPAHTYIRTGDYHGATEANAIAVATDQAYIRANNVHNTYTMMYYPHNLHFLAVSAGMEGRMATAKKAAADLVREVSPNVKMMPAMLEGFLPTTIEILVRFRQWNELLKLPAPDKSLHLLTAMWNFGRGMAYANTGGRGGAESERKAMDAAIRQVPKEVTVGLNPASLVLPIPANMLDARIAELRGDRKGAIAFLRQAVQAEDALSYDEPPGWYVPARESLGRLLLANGEGAAAEKIFREELTHHPNSGRALFGLMESLRKQNRTADIAPIKQQFEAAWKYSDIRLRLEDL